MLQPIRYGGQASAAGEFISTVCALAAQDGSAAWQCAMFGAAASGLPDEVAEAIWGADPTARVVAGGVGQGRLVRSGRGWSLTGHWPAIVAAEVADWLLLTAAAEDGRYWVMVRRGEIGTEMSDAPTGLADAGIRAVDAAELSIPKWSVHPVKAALTDRITGAAAAAAVAGTADGLWRAHVRQVRERLAASYGSAEVGDQTASAQRVARSACDIDAARLQIMASLGDTPPAAVRAQRQAVSRARTVADDLLAGSRRYALDASDPVTRCWRDVHAGCRLVFGLLDTLG